MGAILILDVFFGQQLSSMVERNNISGFGCTDNPRRIKLLSVLAFLWNLLDPYLGLNTGLSSGEHCALNFMANCLLDYRCIVCSVIFFFCWEGWNISVWPTNRQTSITILGTTTRGSTICEFNLQLNLKIHLILKRKNLLHKQNSKYMESSTIQPISMLA